MLKLGTLRELEQLERLAHAMRLRGLVLNEAYIKKYATPYDPDIFPEPGMYDAVKGGPVHKDFKISGAFSPTKVRGWHEDVIALYRGKLDNFQITDEEYLEATRESTKYLAGS